MVVWTFTRTFRRKTKNFYKRSLVKAWIYKDGALKPKQDDVSNDEDMERSGMYYKCANGDSYWDIENMKAFINMLILTEKEQKRLLQQWNLS